MIVDELQYVITRRNESEFEKAIKQWEQNAQRRVDEDPLRVKAVHEGMSRQLADLREELADYENFREFGI